MQVDNLLLEKCIGKGSFGEVYLSKKKDSSTLFATKKIERDKIENNEGMKYLKNEILILHSLKHKNIVKFEDVKKTKKHFYIVMEYCNGGELSKALEKYQVKYGKPFSEEIVQHLMRQITSAIKYIHELKIIHRDIKLDNILLHFDSDEDKEKLNMMKAQVKIIDFGFACRISKSGLQYSTLGSPIYMDPTILKKLNSSGKKERQLGYDQKADIWSLGTVCYEMLIGRPAFDAEDMQDLVNKVEDGSYNVPTGLSREVISFLNGMLQYEAKQRLTAEQLINHPFLKKDVKEFHQLKLSVKMNTKGKGLTQSIWSIFTLDDENKLNKIKGMMDNDTVDETVELEENKIKKYHTQNNETNNGNSIKSTYSFPSSNNNVSGPMLPMGQQGIPGNPVNQNIQGMTQQELEENNPGYSFRGGIFDA